MKNRDLGVFLVDDNPANTRLLSTILAREDGFSNVFSYNDSSQALKDFYLIKPQLILLDMKMPKLDGIGFLKEIYLEIKAANVAVIVLTASNDEHQRLEALTLGAHDYIEKPLCIMETMQRIKNVINLQYQRKDLVELSHTLDSELKQSNETLQSVSNILKVLYSKSSEYVFVVDKDGFVVEYNDSAKIQFHQDLLEKQRIKDILQLSNANLQAKELSINGKKHGQAPTILENRYSHLMINGEPHYIYIFKDVSQRIQDQEKLKLLAETHYITKLPNRNQLDKQAKRIAKNLDHNEEITFIFISFCESNKILHSYGPKIFHQGQLAIASILKDTTLHTNSSLIHWSSYDFLMICSVERITELNLDIVNKFEHGLSTSGLTLHLTPSVGFYIQPIMTPSIDWGDCVKNASVAAYQSFINDTAITQFDVVLQTKLADKKLIENKLPAAVTTNAFYMVYQPIIELSTGNITGAEALIRWNDSELGMVPPDTFIPIAEQTGMIVEIGDFVIKSVFSDYSRLKKQYPKLEKLSLNVAPPQLNQDFIENVKSNLIKCQVNASDFKLEITETSFLDDFERVNPILWQLKSLGFSLAIDDFGTGYSSLSYLLNLPIDTLKIDRVFIASIFESPKCLVLVKSIVSMCNSLELTVVAEGIEDDKTNLLLAELGIQLAQGYFYGKPEKLMVNNHKQENIYLA